MNVLVCDTSSQALTTGLFTDTFKEVRTLQGRTVQHSERLIPTVIELCNDAKIDTKDIDLLVCTRGPGSFTGLRIGMAAFKGMAFALGKPIVSVSTLEAYASCVGCIGAFEGAVVPVIDAKKQRWYLAAFSESHGSSNAGQNAISRLIPDTDGTEADLVEALSPYCNVLVTGPDAQAFAEELTKVQNFKDKHIFVDTKANEAIATTLYELGIKQYETNGADDIGQGPVYLRKSDAEIALEEKQAARKLSATNQAKAKEV